MSKAYTLYVLYSHKDKRLYVGQTADLYRRLELHFRGLVKATARRRPLSLVHKENFGTRLEAANRERFLKSLWGAREKERMLGSFLKNIR